jgi:hypothetical protein
MTKAFETWGGLKVLDRDGEQVGTLQCLFVDRRTGEPAWGTVKTGMFGHTGRAGLATVFVPLAGVERAGRHLQLTVRRDAVRGAPRLAAGAAVSPEDERRLYRHYDCPGDAPAEGSESALERVL